MPGVDVQATIATGVDASLAMALAAYMLGAGGLTYLDIDELLAERVGRKRAPALVAVFFGYLAVGVGLVAAYAAWWARAPARPDPVAGLAFGALLWVAGTSVLLPFVVPLARKHPFAVRYGRGGRRWLGASLAAHALYGVLVGTLYPLLAGA